MDVSKDELTVILEAATPHIVAAALSGHVNRGPIEGFVGERCECGRWSDSDDDYVTHIAGRERRPMTNHRIPTEATEAAARVFYGTALDDVPPDDLAFALNEARMALEVAVPHIEKAAYERGWRWRAPALTVKPAFKVETYDGTFTEATVTTEDPAPSEEWHKGYEAGYNKACEDIVGIAPTIPAMPRPTP